MSALSDLLMIERALGKGSKKNYDPIKLYTRMKKLIEGDKKKKDEKKGWAFEDRVCLGLLVAFAAIPLALLYRWGLHILAAG